MKKVSKFLVRVGSTSETTDILAEIIAKEAVSAQSILFDRIAFDIINEASEASTRTIILNQKTIKIFPEQTLEINNIEISSLTAQGYDAYINIFYEFGQNL